MLEIDVTAPMRRLTGHGTIMVR
eukprot:COSAG06_NODE_32027_length_512_cov_1.154964_2_plen_22_part_01